MADSYVEHNLVADKTVEYREYQEFLSDSALKQSTLVVLPTGTGKTIVSLRVTAERLLNNNGGVSVLLAPTKPLVDQHYETYTNLLDIADERIIKFTGETSPDKRESIWSGNCSMVIATPQVVENDLISGRISMENVVHLTLDECHRATGEYSYVYIAEKYENQSSNPLITGLSASPGDTKEEILEICRNIRVESAEIITESDDMIQPYIHNTDVSTRRIDISDEILEARDILQSVYKDRLQTLYDEGFSDSRSKTLSRSDLNRIRGNIQKEMQNDSSSAYEAMSIWAECMKLNRAIELIETQGVESFLEYYERLEEEARSDDSSKAVERLISDIEVQESVQIAREFDGTYKKIESLRAELVNSVKINQQKALVFTKSRDTVETLINKLSSDFKVGRLVGQSDAGNSEGMTQKQQKEAVREFSNGDTEVLISTQIGEEGLDISDVGVVILYEPATKGINQVQRIGRTGRSQKGRVVILVANETRDVGMYYKSKQNVEQMKSDVSELQDIDDIKNEIQEELQEETKQATLTDNLYSDTKRDSDSQNDYKPQIICDSRETNSSVVRNLDTDTEVDVVVENNMSVGDYVLSEDCVVERKSIEDFYDTIVSNRSLFEQIKNMTQNYSKPILLIEGNESKLQSKNIHPNAIAGVKSSIVADFDASIIGSQNEEDTSRILKSLAEKEQTDESSTVNPHGNKDTQSLKSQQEYIVSSIESIGPKTAQRLLSEFESINSIANAGVGELKSVDGVGEETAKKVYSILRADYDTQRLNQKT